MIIYFLLLSDEMYKEFTVEIMANAQSGPNPKSGLAIIFGVVNKMGPQGTDLDIKNIKTTFDGLNFATWVIKNPTPTIMKKSVKIVSEYLYFSIKLKWLVFYYAGHGGSIDKKGYFVLPCDNDKHENFSIDEVINQFQPINPNCHLEDRKRLFLFDCCLKEDTAKTLPTTTPLPFNPHLPCYQPPNDYTIVVHATYYGGVAQGDYSNGGAWTIKLCDNIKEFAKTKTVNEILSKTRNDVKDMTQYKVQAPFQLINCGDDYLISGMLPVRMSLKSIFVSFYYEIQC